MKYIFIHHSAIKQDGKPQFTRIDNFHKRKWNYKSSLGFYGGYNYLIESDGIVKQYRKVGEETIAQKGYNFNSISICLAGNFELDMVTQKQKESLDKLLSRLQGRYPGAKIRLHNEVRNTLCPGKNLIAWVKNRNKPSLYSIQQRILELTRKVAALIRLFRLRR